MNSTKNIGEKFVGLVFATALSLASLGHATAADRYRFEAAGPASGDTLAIRLIDDSNGQAVSDAHVYSLHRQWIPAKGEPRFLDRRIALEPDGHGAFTYQGNDAQTGVTIRLVAKIDDTNSDILGSVRVGN
jgi:hypothetical protein